MKILVGMSGGVDSTVAALLLKQAGHDVIGATMTIWDNSDTFRQLTGKGCFSPHDDDINQAKQICQNLDIPHIIIDCTKQFKQIVLTNFCNEYQSGRTPNPCIVCNSKIKFSVLPNAARSQNIEFDKFATGHYARLYYNKSSKLYQIMRGIDCKKDQSYFLYRLNQEQLSQIILPLGDKTKSEIRELAKKAGLSVSDKPDSQDFYTGPLNDILQFPHQKGVFKNKIGQILGTHNGYWQFTIGQRRGLGISSERPLYVIDIIKENNEVILGHSEECFQTSLTATDLIWQIPTPTTKFNCQARIRSSQTPFDVIVQPQDNRSIIVTFDAPQNAVTPGQSIVLNDDEKIIGGGIIS